MNFVMIRNLILIIVNAASWDCEIVKLQDEVGGQEIDPARAMQSRVSSCSSSRRLIDGNGDLTPDASAIICCRLYAGEAAMHAALG